MSNSSVNPIYKLLFICLLLISNKVIAQKPLLTNSTSVTWPYLYSNEKITNDGNYIIYTVGNQPLNNKTLFLKTSSDSTLKTFLNANAPSFVDNSQYLAYINEHDSLAIINLLDLKSSFYKEISKYTDVSNKDRNLLILENHENKNSLILVDIPKNTLLDTLNYVESFDTLNSKINSLIYLYKNPDITNRIIRIYDLNKQQSNDLYSNKEIVNLTINTARDKVCFITPKPLAGSNSYQLIKIDLSVQPFIIDSFDIPQFDPTQETLLNFTVGDCGILYSQSLPDSPNHPIVDIVSNQSKFIPYFTQPNNKGAKIPYNDPIIYYDFTTRKCVPVTNKYEFLEFTPQVRKDYLILINGFGNQYEWAWNPTMRSHVYLHQLSTGKRIELCPECGYKAGGFNMSPDGQYILFYNPDSKNYFSYSIDSGIYRNLTNTIQDKWTITKDYPLAYTISNGSYFINNGKSILIESQKDIYKISINNSYKPVNLTNNYGKRHHLMLRLPEDITLKMDQIDTGNIIITAFNTLTKQDGFFTCSLSKTEDPVLLSMSDFYWNGNPEEDTYQRNPWIRASGTEVYIQKGMNYDCPPNLFITKDFKTFQNISHLNPEKGYNWMTAQLIRWKTFDGTYDDAILYKPENFNPKIKYPVIFYYYERRAESLHAYCTPGISVGPLNIANFVSNGYLVCVPNIYYKIGHPAHSVVNDVTSCAEYLSHFSFVDSTKLGLQGHSRGGYETNVLITHSKIFAAAVSACGMTNYTALYNRISLTSTGESAMEDGYQRIGKTLWQDKNLYIENSPIFYADKVTTPVLFEANQLDWDIPQEQGIELFTALRRLKKDCWLLHYRNMGHVLSGAESLDYTIRMEQFFDYYLKGTSKPTWMQSSN
jgi:dipeptidyl aminopeptidase/acylaminoacyl peptidase